MAILGLLLCAGLLLLGGIAMVDRPRLTEGMVVDKSFTPAHTTTYTSRIWTGKTAVPRIRLVRHPDVWTIKVSGISDKGDEKTEWWTVSEDVYNSVEIGDEVERDVETDAVFKVEDGGYE